MGEIVETGPDHAVHSFARGRSIDLRQIIFECFGVDYYEQTVGEILKVIGFSHISPCPRHPADQRYENAYLFGAICPARGVGATLTPPFIGTEAMQMHLD